VGTSVLQGLNQLLELQRLDDHLVDSQTEHQGIPARRNRIAEERSAADERLSAAKQTLEDVQLAMRQAESALQDRETLLAKLESQQFQVKSNNAYTALLHEMAQAREAISEHETKILEHMEAIERATRDLEEAKQNANSVQLRHDEEMRSIDARQGELVSEIERFRELRAQAGQGVERNLLSHYERVAAGRRPAVVSIAEERCSGCLVQIPPQSFIEIRRGEKVVTCGNCSRILLHAERIQSEVIS
jgi:predicted  nucleic acid-binding Zn-ribbon protein